MIQGQLDSLRMNFVYLKKNNVLFFLSLDFILEEGFAKQDFKETRSCNNSFP